MYVMDHAICSLCSGFVSGWLSPARPNNLATIAGWRRQNIDMRAGSRAGLVGDRGCADGRSDDHKKAGQQPKLLSCFVY
jgi:hypothetical protein